MLIDWIDQQNAEHQWLKEPEVEANGEIETNEEADIPAVDNR